MFIRWEIRDFLYREIINLFSVLSVIFTEIRENVYWKHARAFFSRCPRAIPRVFSEKNTTLKCGVFGASGDFGLINLVLQTVLFSCNPNRTITVVWKSTKMITLKKWPYRSPVPWEHYQKRRKPIVELDFVINEIQNEFYLWNNKVRSRGYFMSVCAWPYSS